MKKCKWQFILEICFKLWRTCWNVCALVTSKWSRFCVNSPGTADTRDEPVSEIFFCIILSIMDHWFLRNCLKASTCFKTRIEKITNEIVETRRIVAALRANSDNNFLCVTYEFYPSIIVINWWLSLLHDTSLCRSLIFWINVYALEKQSKINLLSWKYTLEMLTGLNCS